MSEVACAGCGRAVPMQDADVSANGYLCAKCAMAAEVEQHLRNDEEEARAHNRVPDPAFRLMVEANERRAPEPGDDTVPPPEVLEPFVEADDERREDPAAPAAPVSWTSTRYLCIVCFSQASPEPGQCKVDRVPLSDLQDPEVVDELRGFIRRRANRREGIRVGLSFAFSTVATVAIVLALNLGFARGPFKIILMALWAGVYFPSRKLWRPIRARNHLPELLAAVGLR